MKTLHISEIQDGLTVGYRALPIPHTGSAPWVPQEEHLAAVAAARVRKAVDDGYMEWARKPHNEKWVRKIDGTPIPNDLIVCIQQSIIRNLKEQPK
jgi:hypothetical protein